MFSRPAANHPVHSPIPFLLQVTFIDQQHPELPLAASVAAVPRNFFPARNRVKLIEGYSDPKDTRASRAARSTTSSAANKPHRHHSQGNSTNGAGSAPGQVSRGDFRNYSNLTAPVPKLRNKSRNSAATDRAANKRSNRRKVSDSGKRRLILIFYSTTTTVFVVDLSIVRRSTVVEVFVSGLPGRQFVIYQMRKHRKP